MDEFKALLTSAEGSDADEMLESLYRANDLCNDVGLEHLISACEESGCKIRGQDNLPAECLALEVFAEHEDAFDLAYDRYYFGAAERFSCYQGRPRSGAFDGARLASQLQVLLAEQFRGSKGSERVLVRQFRDRVRLNVVIYHEKRCKATLSFKGAKQHPRVTPMVFRPAQQDLVCFDLSTGRVEIEAGSQKEEVAIRSAFAEICFGRKDFLDDDAALKCLTLDSVKRTGFRVNVDTGDTGTLAELHLKLPQQHNPTIILRSKDVLDTIRINHLEDLLAAASVRRVVFKVTFHDEQRVIPVELAPPNKMRFRRATHSEDIFRYLRNWGILRG